MTDNNLKITYKGEDIVDTDISTATTKTLKTAGKYCEGDITITAQGGSGGDAIPLYVKSNIDLDISTYRRFKCVTGDGTGNGIITNVMFTGGRFGYTVKAGFKLNSYTNTNIIGTKGNNNNLFRIGLSTSNHKLFVRGLASTNLVGNTAVSLNEYHEIELRVSGLNSSIYLDGELDGTLSGSIASTSGNYIIGAFYSAVGATSPTGSIDGNIYYVKVIDPATNESILDFSSAIQKDNINYAVVNSSVNGVEFLPLDTLSVAEELSPFVGVNPLSVDTQTRFGLNAISFVGGTYDEVKESTDLKGIDFSEIRVIPSYGLYYQWYKKGAKNVPSLNFNSLQNLGEYGLYYSFYNASFAENSEVSFPKLKTFSQYSLSNAFYGCTNIEKATLFSDESSSVTNITQGNFLSNAFYNCNLSKGFYVYKIKNITGSSAFANVVYATSIKYFNDDIDTSFFPDLETMDCSSGMGYSFYRRGFKIAKKWNVFPKLTSLNGSSVLSQAFRYNEYTVPNTYPQKQHIITFPKLQYVGNTTGANIFNYTFGNPSGNGWKYMWFPMLKTVGYASTSSYGIFSYAFTGTVKDDYFEVCFPELESITSSSTSTTSSYSTFYNCTVVKKFWLPKLNNVTGTPNISANGMFRNCTQSGLEIHFGKENETYIRSLAGFANKFGATNATIYFDCINHITVNGVVYNRDGEHYITELCEKTTSTSTITHPDDRYSWKDSNGNIVYTLECWTPAVGDNVYDASDNVVGTISAVS